VSSTTDFQPLELRLAPEYRRCAVYAGIGYVLIAATVVGLQAAEVKKNPWLNTIIFLSLLGVATLLVLASAFRYRLLIDEHGIWRRRLVYWDLWPWEAFELGKVKFGTFADQLTFPEKGWYWRSISASLLGKADRVAYETVVARYLFRPPPPEPPEALTLKYGLWRLELSDAGVRLTKRPNHDAPLVPWEDVIRVEELRASHHRPDFATLELHLPEPTGLVRLNRQRFLATRDEVDMIVPFLRRHLDDGRFQMTTLRGPPADVAEADRRLARLAQAEQHLRKLHRINWYFHGFGALFLSVPLALGNRPNPMNWGRADCIEAAVVVGTLSGAIGLHGMLGTAVTYFRVRDLRRDREEVLKWRLPLEPLPKLHQELLES
jgi:hypothetical protein